MKLYFARHGQTDSNAKMINDQPIAEIDDPLNQLGIHQAEVLAKQLKEIEFDAIISSPLKRAYQTAEIVSKYHNLPITVSDVWRERSLEIDIDITSWNNLFDFDKNIKVENGESLSEFFERVYSGIDRMKQEYKNRSVLLVSHGGVQHAFYTYANKLPLSGNVRISPMQNCEYRIYDL